VFCLASFMAFAQIHDTTLYRQNNVKSVSQWVHMLGFEKSNDTCLSNVKHINKKGSPTYIKIDYHCQGWDIITELRYTYNDNNDVTGLSTIRNDEVISDLKMELDSFGRIRTEINTFFDPPGQVEVRNVYFGEGKNADSVYTVEINDKDTTYLVTKNTYVGDNLLKSNTTDVNANKPVNMLTNRYDKKGRIARTEFIYFLGYDNDDITLFEYNEKDQIIKTKSELTDLAAEFYYDKSGLPIKTFYYNKFGTLEREVWYKYEYYE